VGLDRESFGNLRGIDGIGWCSLLERMQTGYLLLAICLLITPVEMGGIKENNSFLINKKKGKKTPSILVSNKRLQA
jgi:hypothetical protein